MEAYTDKPPLPPLHSADYMIQHLWDVGPGVSFGMGLLPLSFQEIAAWQHGCGYRLRPWEVQSLRAMSVAYVAQMQKSTEPNCPAPWQSMADVDHTAVADKLRSVFAAYSQ